jgi:hypothetical protein
MDEGSSRVVGRFVGTHATALQHGIVYDVSGFEFANRQLYQVGNGTGSLYYQPFDDVVRLEVVTNVGRVLAAGTAFSLIVDKRAVTLAPCQTGDT